ncbi:MAG: MarR family transcriptional regulator [Nitrospirae bacterium]|nr:MarR family transcriptional regulator [Nitrospirota bacterium]MBI3593609.1 MarR family transcriptional regulator [Nitrospirota bacterium]
MGSKYKGNHDEVRALSAFINLMRASDSVGSRAFNHIQTEQLTPSQFGVLEVLLHGGPMCQTDLGEKLLRTGATITSVIDHLEKSGLVERERSKDDRRFITVCLTKKGEVLIQRIFPHHARVITKELSALTPSEQVELRRLCKKLGRKNG